jgi:ketosteroid isomerase-like protein
MLRKAVALIVVAAVCACRPVNRTDPVAIRHVIDSLNAKIATSIAAGQADSIADVFAQNVWQMPPNSPPLVGRDSLLSFWRNAVATGKWQFDLKTDDVITADSLAIERGHFTLKVVAGPKAQYPSFEDHGNYVVVWRRESDGKWRAVWDAPVSTVPMPMPAIPPAAAPKKT